MAIPPGKLPPGFPGNPNVQPNNQPQIPRNVLSNPNIVQLAKLAQQQANGSPQSPLSPSFPASLISSSGAGQPPPNFHNAIQALPQLLKQKLSNPAFLQQVAIQNPAAQNTIQGLVNNSLVQQAQNANMRIPHIPTPDPQRRVQFAQFQQYSPIQIPNGDPQSPTTPPLSPVTSPSIHPSMAPPPPKKTKESVPKADVSISSLPLSAILKNCQVTPRFLPQVQEFQEKNNVQFSEKAISFIAYALKVRMRYVVQECARICHNRVAQSRIQDEHSDYVADQKKLLDRQQQKDGGNENHFVFQTQQKNLLDKYQQKVLYYLPSEPYYTEIPIIKLAQLEAERQIIQSGATITPPKAAVEQQPNSKDATNDALRNAVICGIASRTPRANRDKITECVQEGLENIQPDVNSLSHLGFIKKQKAAISFSDVYQFVENDFFFTPKKLVTPEFSLQLRMIENLPRNYVENNQNESSNT